MNIRNLKPITCRGTFIKHIIKKYNFKSYLEIGLSHNPLSPYRLIDGNEVTKCSIDIDKSTNADYCMKSIDFFNEIRNNKEHKYHGFKWDVIFIDGDHRSDVVYKDILDSYEFLNENGIIFLHDILPEFYYRSLEMPLSFTYNQQKLGVGLALNDAWKVVPYILKNHSGMNICSLVEKEQDFICGLGVITKTQDRNLMNKEENQFYRYDIHRNNLRKFSNLINVEDFDIWIEKPYHNFEQKGENMTISFSQQEVEIAKKSMPYTMTSLERMLGIIHKVREVNKNKIPGCLIECGTWKCGILATMCLADDLYESDRKIYGFDSYKYDEKKSGLLPQFKISFDEAKNNLSKLKADRCKLQQGYFEDSFPKIRDEIQQIAVLRVDAMMATIECLEEFYDKVSVGGYIVLDDYGHYPECKKAVDDFRSSRGIKDPIHYTDYTEVWWKKT